jgi:hypothetical protein
MGEMHMDKKIFFFSLLIGIILCQGVYGHEHPDIVHTKTTTLSSATPAPSLLPAGLIEFSPTAPALQYNQVLTPKHDSVHYAGMNLFFNVSAGPLPSTIAVILLGLVTAVIMRPRR